MRVITISRRPVVEENVASNCVEHGTGGLNIDATRIGFQSEQDKDAAFPGGATTSRQVVGGGLGAGWREHDRGAFSAQQHSAGRWPANLILQHQPGCQQTGTTTAPGYQINRWTDGAKPFGGGAGHDYESEKQPDEQVATWDCADGCAVRALSEKTPVTKSGPKKPVDATNWKSKPFDNKKGWNSHSMSGHGQQALQGHGDTGTAARFFQQVETDMSNDSIPEDLWAYLTTLISPPEKYEPNIIAAENLSEVDFDSYEDLSVHGIITVGDPTEYLTKINRVLKPGGHFLVISERNDPNCQVVCNIEDIGYEVRDSICYLDSADDKFHYVAKAASRERNAGLKDRSTHPTMKPIAIMTALLADVPKDCLVCDPFLGSGTTGIACLQTGHDFVGIEREDEYFEIADARVRYWDAENSTKIDFEGATIESDLSVEEGEDNLADELEGLFG